VSRACCCLKGTHRSKRSSALAMATQRGGWPRPAGCSGILLEPRCRPFAPCPIGASPPSPPTAHPTGVGVSPALARSAAEWGQVGFVLALDPSAGSRQPRHLDAHGWPAGWRLSGSLAGLIPATQVLRACRSAPALLPLHGFEALAFAFASSPPAGGFRWRPSVVPAGDAMQPPRQPPLLAARLDPPAPRARSRSNEAARGCVPVLLACCSHHVTFPT